MKTKNPFGPILPPGSALGQVAAQHRSHVRVMAFVGVAVGVFGLAVLLIGGCIHGRHNEESAIASENNVLVASATTNTSAPARLPVMVTNSQARAPMVSARPSPPPVAPSVTPKAAPLIATKPTTTKNYSVVKGDTLSKIAKANGISASALARANPGVELAKLKIGHVLHIPAVGQKQTLPLSGATQGSVKDKQ